MHVLTYMRWPAYKQRNWRWGPITLGAGGQDIDRYHHPSAPPSIDPSIHSRKFPRMDSNKHVHTYRTIQHQTNLWLLGMQENYFPYFCARGYDCVAPSYRGQGGSDAPPDGHVMVPRNHALDVSPLIDENTVLIGHSFGGGVVQW